MDDLRLIFLVLGLIAIVAILIHGLWTIRNNAKVKKTRVEPKTHMGASATVFDSSTKSGFDQDGVGQVRVIKNDAPSNLDTSPIGANSVLASSMSQTQDTSEVGTSDKLTSESTLSIDTENQSASKSEEILTSFGPHFVDGQIKPSDLIDTPANMQGEDDEPVVLENLSLGESDMDFVSNVEVDDKTKIAEPTKETSPPLYGSVVTQPKPGFMQKTETNDVHASSFNDEPPSFLVKKETTELSEDTVEHAQESSLAGAPDSAELKTSATLNSGSHSEDIQTESVIADNQPAQKISDSNVSNTPKTETQDKSQKTESKGFAAQARRLVSRKRKSVADKIRKEPKIASNIDSTEEQMKIDFDEQNQAKPSSNQSDKKADVAPEVLILHVRAKPGQEIEGAALLPSLLTLGFKFGEQDIFHRHVNTNGKGQVLFSLANMFQPGHFDIDSIETFKTRGLALFMMLPIEGDPQQVFNMMHNATRKLADEFSCEVLDGTRKPLDKLALQKYSERIRMFQKQRS